MICLSSPTIMLMGNDGTKHRFDSEELQSRLICSCLDSGIKDYWLAEDLTNAVENALAFQSDNGITFAEGEVNFFLIKILENAGYPNVAENFRRKNKISVENIILSQEAIKKLFKAQLGVKDVDVAHLSEKVLNACDTLSLSDASPSLILELGRHYKNIDISVPKFKNLNFQDISSTPWILPTAQIILLLSSDTKKLVDSSILDIAGVSRLFPSLKINLKLEALAKKYGLEPVITELILFPYFETIINGINEIITRVNRHFELNKEHRTGSKLPVYLRFLDIYGFSKKYLGAKMPGGEKFCGEIALMIAENLDYPVVIKGLKLR